MGGGFSQTLPGEPAKAGYYTKGVGKMHFGPQRLRQSGKLQQDFQTHHRHDAAGLSPRQMPFSITAETVLQTKSIRISEQR